MKLKVWGRYIYIYIFVIAKFKDKNLVPGVGIYLFCKKNFKNIYKCRNDKTRNIK